MYAGIRTMKANSLSFVNPSWANLSYGITAIVVSLSPLEFLNLSRAPLTTIAQKRAIEMFESRELHLGLEIN